MFGIWLVVINIINGYVLPYRQSLSRRMTLPTITLPKVHFTDNLQWRVFTIIDNLLLFNNMKHSEYSE